MSTLQELFRQVGALFRWWVVVAPWEQAVRVRFGKHVRVLGAVMHLRVPFADLVFRQSIRRRFTPVPTQTITTLDGKTVTVRDALGYAIKDIGVLYNSLHDAEDVVQTEAQAAVVRFISRKHLEKCGPAAIEAHVTEVLALDRYGIGDVEFRITDFAAVRTYRLIQGEPKVWGMGAHLSTTREDSEPT